MNQTSELTDLPRYSDRKAGADLITRLYFRVAPRTLEAWPVPVRQINGRAHYATTELLAYARSKMELAPPPRLGGRQPKPMQQQAAA